MPVKNQCLIQKTQSACSLVTLITQQLICCKTYKLGKYCTSRNVSFNENNLPGFPNETEDIEESFLYLDLDKVREELQDTSNSSELSSEVELTEIESVQECENNTETEVDQEIKEEISSPSVKSKSKINIQFNPNIAVKNIERKPSKIPIPVKNSQQKKVKPPSRLQMIGKLGEIAIPSVDQKTFEL